MAKANPIEHYLERYSQAVDVLLGLPANAYQYVLVLPACGESAASLNQVLQHVADQSVLVVVIVNRPAGHVKSSVWQAINQQFIETVLGDSEVVQSDHHVHHCHRANGCDILLLDFNQLPFGSGKGVGQARRIAADTALALIHQGVVEHPWIFSTDADVTLPGDYFDCTMNLPVDCVAVCLPFNHHGTDEQIMSWQSQYDFKLRYYQQGVKFIRSKYTYIPLGSTLIADATAYAQVRGFPCRSGGEDFYLLNKLAKQGSIKQPDQPVIAIKARLSDRVPFGTGPAVIQIQAQCQSGAELTYYNPAIFHHLKVWNSALLAFYDTEKLPFDSMGLNDHWKIQSVLSKARHQAHTQQRWQQFIHEWFDAFKILKSVHYIQHELLPVSMEHLLAMPLYHQIVMSKA